MSSKTTRRVFLGQTAPAVIGAGMMATQALGEAKKGILGANDRANIGIIGTGGRGGYLTYIFNIVGSQVVAVCDLNRQRMEKTQKEICQGNADMIHDYRKLLERKDIDAVVVATNGQWKTLPAIEACLAGKDVYLEKPLGTSIGEGQAVVKAMKKTKRVIQMGTQQHSWEHYRKAVEIIRSGRLGNISNVAVWDYENFYPGFGSAADAPAPDYLDWDFWVGPSPKREYNPLRYDRHYWFFDYGGSWQLEWAVHHYDIVHWAMGIDTPIAATGVGGRLAFSQKEHDVDWPDTFEGTATYPAGPVAKNGFLMTYTLRSGCDQPTDGRHHGKAFYGTDGTLYMDRQGYRIVGQVRDKKKVIEDELVTSSKKEHDVVQDHARNFLKCASEGKQPEANVAVGHLASNPGHLMNISWHLGRSVKWNPETETFIDDPEANAMITKQYRAPWKLPDLS